MGSNDREKGEKRSFKNRRVPKLEFGNEKAKSKNPVKVTSRFRGGILRSGPDWRIAQDDRAAITGCSRSAFRDSTIGDALRGGRRNFFT
jgi:hypothetical protein